MPGVDKECESRGATHHSACKCREEYFRSLATDYMRLREALGFASRVLDRLVTGFDNDIATTPNSYAAADCREAQVKLFAALLPPSRRRGRDR